jgi:hypothetical protein
MAVFRGVVVTVLLLLALLVVAVIEGWCFHWIHSCLLNMEDSY